MKGWYYYRRRWLAEVLEFLTFVVKNFFVSYKKICVVLKEIQKRIYRISYWKGEGGGWSLCMHFYMAIRQV